MKRWASRHEEKCYCEECRIRQEAERNYNAAWFAKLAAEAIMSYENPPEEEPEFYLSEQFGNIQISADIFGIHIHEMNGVEQATATVSAEDAEKVARFMQQWLPRIQAASKPKCPACHAEMKPTEPGSTREWECTACQMRYNGGPFGGDLREIAYTIQTSGSEIDFDPFLDEGELP